MDFIIKKLIKNYNDTGNQEVRVVYGKFASFTGLIFNIFLFLGKIIVGTISGSLSVTADAINNLSDASSSVISLFGFKLASKPADEEHPYGHGRYEYISALMVAVLIMLIGIELFKSSIEKIINPTPTKLTVVSFGVLIASILVKLWMMFFYKKIGKRISSQTLFAVSADSRNDVITTTAVLIACLISHYTNIHLDGWMALTVALFILISGFGIIKDTLDPLLGKAPDKERVEEIKEIILSYPGVLGTHDLILHDYGPGRQFASVHVEMAAEEDVIESHDVIDNIERDFLKDYNLHLIVHYDPISTKDGITNDLRLWISEKIKTIDSSLTIHDLRIVPGITHTNVIFDCSVVNEIGLSDSELKSAVSDLVRSEYPCYNCVITVDRSFAAHF